MGCRVAVVVHHAVAPRDFADDRIFFKGYMLSAVQLIRGHRRPVRETANAHAIAAGERVLRSIGKTTRQSRGTCSGSLQSIPVPPAFVQVEGLCRKAKITNGARIHRPATSGQCPTSDRALTERESQWATRFHSGMRNNSPRGPWSFTIGNDGLRTLGRGYSDGKFCGRGMQRQSKRNHRPEARSVLARSATQRSKLLVGQ
jgi:hypothetical protein